MTILCTRCLSALFVLCTFCAGVTLGQTPIVESAIIRNTANGGGQVTLGVVGSGTNGNQILTLPSTAATAPDQVLSITSINGSTANLGWVTPVSGKVDIADTLNVDVTDAQAWTTNLILPVTSGAIYQFIGFVRLSRGAAGNAEDDFQFSFESAVTYDISYGVQCITCSDGTTYTPGYKANCTSRNTCELTINPGGSDGGTVNAYLVSGIINVTAGTGDLKFSFNKNGGSNATTVYKDSYVVARKIN